MNFKKAVKKIMVLGVGAAFLGATVMSATAADLKDYPSPFVKDGKFNAVIVVGDEANAGDVLGSIDIATRLQYASRVKKTVKTGAAGSVSLVGDSKKVEEATNLLELGENLTSIRTSVTSSDLNSLKDGSITNQYGTFTYTQVIDLPKYAYVRYLKDTSNGAGVHVDDEPFDYLVLPVNSTSATTHVYNLRMSFSPALKSDHSTSGTNHLKDVKNKKLKILEKEYDILKADHTAYGTLKLVLMAGAVRDIMDEGNTKTFTVGGKDYEVTLDFVGSTDTKFTVNGQVTDTLKEADTFRLADGTELGVVDILSQEFAGGKRSVEFTLGATKLVLEDTATFTKGAGGTVTIGSTDSSNVKVDIVTATDTGLNDSSSKVTISSIEVYYDSSEALYVGKGESASAIADAVEGEKGVFFLNGFDYKYEGLSMDTAEEIKLKPSGSTNYKLAFTNKAGVKYDEFLFSLLTTNNSMRPGQATGSTTGHMLQFNESMNVSDEDFLLVSKNKYSRILQMKDVAPGSSTTDNTGTVKFRDTGSGDTYEVTYASLTGNMVLDGNTYLVRLTSDTTSANVGVDMDGSGTIGDAIMGTNSNNGIYTQNEAFVVFPELQTGSSVGSLAANITSGVGNFTLLQVTSPQDEDNQRSVLGVKMAVTSDNKLDISYVNGTFDASTEAASSSTGLYQRGDKQVFEGYAYALADDGVSMPQYGVRALWDKKSTTGTDQDDLTLWVGKTATRANVFVTSGVVTKSETGATEGEVTYYETTPIEVGSAKLAKEVPNIKGMNAIVVGGPCANTAAAELMGNPADCVAGFEEGKAMVKLFENGDNVAVLVAGYSAMDTRRASRVLANYDMYKSKLVGKEVSVAGTSLTEITVSAPAPAASSGTA
ncbi:S-layer protein [Candidatus Woesearchaeota archaeon]|nr:S-layer protein [Candidatus Woesearchaeota archaeon]